jgi:hypothetical protein
MIRRRAVLILVGATALAGVAAGCGSDSSGNTESITVPSVETTTPAVVTTAPTVTSNPDTTPNTVTTPPQTTTQNQKPNQGNGNGGSNPQQDFNNYCKQNPGACGD